MSDAALHIARLRQTRSRRWHLVTGAMAASIAALFTLTLLWGQSFTPPGQVMRALMGEEIRGVTFTVTELRLPRALLSLLAGLSFGLGGAAFQIMLRNPLASPDIIGVSAGASAAAVFALVVLQWTGPIVPVLAVASGLAVAVLIYGLSFKGGVAGTRLILVGIGVAAMLDSFIAWVLTRAPSWTLQEAMRWLSGTVNGAQLDHAVPILAALIVFGGTLGLIHRDLQALRLGDDAAAALGTRTGRTRLTVVVAAVGLIAVATAMTGPIAFVAFLSAPIAARLIGASGSAVLPAGLVGAILVLGGDWVGQFLLPIRYPVGIVTGALGAPYLIWLIIRTNRNGGAL